MKFGPKTFFRWIKEYKAIGLLELLLLSMYPYALCYCFNFQSLSSLLIIAAFFCSTILFIQSKAKFSNDFLTLYVGCMCIVNILYSILHADSSYLIRIIFSLTAYFFIYGFVKKQIFWSFIKINSTLITIQAVLACLAFILFFFGVLPIFSSFINVDNRECFSFGISFSNIILPPISRMSGYFDEPGALAFWGIYALLFNVLYLKNKTIEYCLIFGLLSTLSMAYFIQLIMYILFFKVSNLKSLIPLVVILVLIVTFTINSQSDTYLYKLTIERLDNARGGESSRSELTELAYSYFIKSPLIGNGAKKIESTAYMGDNPYEIPAKDGVIGTFALYFLLFIILFKCKNLKVFYAVIILIAGYLQRPFHVNLMHYLMLYAFFMAWQITYEDKKYKFKHIISTY